MEPDYDLQDLNITDDDELNNKIKQLFTFLKELIRRIQIL